MKKTVLLMVVAMLCTTMYAQRGSQQSRRGGGRSSQPTLQEKKHAFYLGLKAGLTISSMTQPSECDLYDKAGMGFSGGVAGRVRFGKATPNSPAGTGLLGAGIELKYKQNTVKTIGTDESGKQNANLSMGYFEVPVFVQIYPFYKSEAMNSLYLEVGPDFAGTLSRSPKSLTVGNLTGDFSEVTYNIDSNGSKLKGMDLRVMAGIGYDFALRNEKGEAKNLIGINARYYLGTSELAKNFKSKMSSFEISLSWMFNIGNL